MSNLARVLARDEPADKIVPPAGFTATLTTFAAGAMAFLAVFALALSLAAGRLAERWGTVLAQGATVRITVPTDQQAAQVDAAMRVLETTAGVASARIFTDAEQSALLLPWFGEGIDISALPVPRLIAVVPAAEGFDPAGLRLRLQAEAPGAVLDDHARWRGPLTSAATRLRILGWLSIGLILMTTATMITLAARAALSANAQVISVLRLVGATDAFIANAFVRRFTYRAALGALAGVVVAMFGLVLLPDQAAEAGILTGLQLAGWHWLLPLAIPVLSALVAFGATRAAARRTLEELT